MSSTTLPEDFALGLAVDVIDIKRKIFIIQNIVHIV